jgi:7-carboxy-7-deazaguanine synthase
MIQLEEIFHSLQGEGSRRGRPCHFVRLTGCPLRCLWCDTSYAFHGGAPWTVDAIVKALVPPVTRLVCVTGGEPLAQAEVHELLVALCDTGYEVLLETSGALDARGVDRRVVRIFDLKAPGSGEVERNFWPNFDELRASDEVKIVLAGRDDYDWAVAQLKDLDLVSKVGGVLLSPVHGELDPATLAEWILADALPVTLQQQEHKLLWPTRDRGV